MTPDGNRKKNAARQQERPSNSVTVKRDAASVQGNGASRIGGRQAMQALTLTRESVADTKRQRDGKGDSRLRSGSKRDNVHKLILLRIEHVGRECGGKGRDVENDSGVNVWNRHSLLAGYAPGNAANSAVEEHMKTELDACESREIERSENRRLLRDSTRHDYSTKRDKFVRVEAKRIQERGSHYLATTPFAGDRGRFIASGNVRRRQGTFERACSPPNVEPNFRFRFQHMLDLNTERASGSGPCFLRVLELTKGDLRTDGVQEGTKNYQRKDELAPLRYTRSAHRDLVEEATQQIKAALAGIRDLRKTNPTLHTALSQTTETDPTSEAPDNSDGDDSYQGGDV
ncbi:hypothetical protein B0H19DRAFT_1243279 [Mycena capillaripes]|nr:hypothetical protein B0H19DRAFT_1243279 [Mycena capillaripes]